MPTDYSLSRSRYRRPMLVAPPARRRRYARPDPRVKRVVLSDADYALFAAIERHGPLPSSFLYGFTQHLRRDQTHLQNRLTEFYNGDAGGPYLTRPAQQFASFEARYQHLVYGLAPRARLLLAERGLVVRQPVPRSDPFVHRLMCACVGASFEVAAGHLGLRYIATDEILDRPDARQAAGALNPLALPVGMPGQQDVVPDLLFGIEYPRRGYRFFAAECDRNTESIERRNFRQSAFGRKIVGYSAALATGAFRTWWGIPNLHVLTITTSAVHARAILSAIRQQVDPRYRSAFAVALADTFGANWRVPKEPLSELLTGSWQTIGGVRSYSSV